MNRDVQRFRNIEAFHSFVTHPRYGQGPCLTGLNPVHGKDRASFHWRSKPETRIPGTAIIADITVQSYAPVPVTHYFDELRICRECRRNFLFFAAEQKYWYETLKFPLDADCVACIECRKQHQHRRLDVAAARNQIQKLLSLKKHSLQDVQRLIAGLLVLAENQHCGQKIRDQIRHWLNRIPAESQNSQRTFRLRQQLGKLESQQH